MPDICYAHEVENCLDCINHADCVCPECAPQFPTMLEVEPITNAVALAREPIPLPEVTASLDLQLAASLMLLAAKGARDFAEELTSKGPHETALEEIAPYLRTIAEARREWEARRKEYLGPIDEARKAMQATFAAPADVLAEAESILKIAFARLQREEDARQDAVRRIQEADLLRENERLLTASSAAILRGDTEDAEALTVAAAHMPTSIAVAHTKVAGVSTLVTWSAEVTDMMALCHAVYLGTAPSTLVQPNMVALNGMARALKESFAVPGCRAVSKDSVRSR